MMMPLFDLMPFFPMLLMSLMLHMMPWYFHVWFDAAACRRQCLLLTFLIFIFMHFTVSFLIAAFETLLPRFDDFRYLLLMLTFPLRWLISRFALPLWLRSIRHADWFSPFSPCCLPWCFALLPPLMIIYFRWWYFHYWLYYDTYATLPLMLIIFAFSFRPRVAISLLYFYYFRFDAIYFIIIDDIIDFTLFYWLFLSLIIDAAILITPPPIRLSFRHAASDTPWWSCLFSPALIIFSDIALRHLYFIDFLHLLIFIDAWFYWCAIDFFSMLMLILFISSFAASWYWYFDVFATLFAFATCHYFRHCCIFDIDAAPYFSSFFSPICRWFRHFDTPYCCYIIFRAADCAYFDIADDIFFFFSLILLLIRRHCCFSIFFFFFFACFFFFFYYMLMIFFAFFHEPLRRFSPPHATPFRHFLFITPLMPPLMLSFADFRCRHATWYDWLRQPWYWLFIDAPCWCLYYFRHGRRRVHAWECRVTTFVAITDMLRCWCATILPLLSMPRRFISPLFFCRWWCRWCRFAAYFMLIFFADYLCFYYISLYYAADAAFIAGHVTFRRHFAAATIFDAAVSCRHADWWWSDIDYFWYYIFIEICCLSLLMIFIFFSPFSLPIWCLLWWYVMMLMPRRQLYDMMMLMLLIWFFIFFDDYYFLPLITLIMLILLLSPLIDVSSILFIYSCWCRQMPADIDADFRCH